MNKDRTPNMRDLTILHKERSITKSKLTMKYKIILLEAAIKQLQKEAHASKSA